MSKPAAQAHTTPLLAHRKHQSFFHVLIFTLLIWYLYRYLFRFPVWFDESLGKLVFFALPIWLYVVIAQTQIVYEAISTSKMMKGLYLGLAFGGLFGFVGVFAGLSGRTSVLFAPLFLAPLFWWEFLLALLTGFWESLFFFGWIFQVSQRYFKGWGLLRVSVFTSLFFVLFHIPNALLRFDVDWGIGFERYFFSQVFVLFFFAIGQAFIFVRYRNVYLSTITHAIWGMVLMIYGS